jgi:hypothetical protein
MDRCWYSGRPFRRGALFGEVLFQVEFAERFADDVEVATDVTAMFFYLLKLRPRWPRFTKAQNGEHNRSH